MIWFSILLPALVIVIVCAGFHRIERRLTQMFATIHDFAVAVDAETNAIATRIDALIAAAQQGNVLSPADQTELQAISDRLTSLGADPANPIPA